MKKNYFLFLLLFAQFALAQINYEPAYIVDNDGKRKDVLIKNGDWVDSPISIDVKDSEKSSSYTLKVNDVLEFGFIEGAIFQRYKVALSNYEEDLSKIDYSSDFKFVNQDVFLKVLSTGNITLYSFRNGTVKFFYKKDGEVPQQLLYKKFYNEKEQVQKVTNYRMQIAELSACPNLSLDYLSYKESSLITVFNKINNGCKEKVNNSTTKKFDFNVKLVVEGHSMSTTASSTVYYWDNIKTDGKLIPKFGVEVEYFFPYNKRSFSLVLAPKYYNYTNEQLREYDVFPHNQTIRVESSTLQIPVGLRYHHYLSNDSAVFVGVSYVLNKSLNSVLKINSVESELDYSKNAVLFGFGMKYRRVMMELQYESSNFYGTDMLDEIKNKSIGLSLKYKVF